MFAELWNNIVEWFTVGGFVEWLSGIDVWLKTAVPNMIKCVLVLIIGYWLAGLISRIISRALKRSKLSAEVAAFAGSAARLVLRIAAILWAVSFLNINIISVLTALSAVGITLGLALKDTITSLTSGFIIMDSRPFSKGDLVEIDGALGRIEKIELTNTTLLTNDNKTLVIPNSVVTASKVTNYTANPHRRMDLHFSVKEECGVEKTKELLSAAVEECKYRLPEYNWRVAVVDVNDGRITFEVRFWINANDFTPANFEMHERIASAFAENRIRTA